MAEVPALENEDVEVLEDEHEERDQETSSLSSPSEAAAGDVSGPGAVDSMIDDPMVGNDNGRTNAASSCSGIAMPMTPGLPPLTPDLIPVPPPDDLNKVLLSTVVRC